MKPRTVRLVCGCVNFFEREATLEMCPQHEQAFREVHVRWMLEHRQRQPLEDVEL